MKLTVLVTFEDFLLTNLYKVQTKLLLALSHLSSDMAATKLSFHAWVM